MPIYEYVCQNCGEPLEKLQKLSDEPLKQCPACGEPALKRKVSAAGFRLSGGGWYETDFKSDSRRNLSGGSDTESSASKSSDKSDSTSASKADSPASKSASGAASADTGKAGKSAAKPAEKSKPAAPSKSSGTSSD